MLLIFSNLPHTRGDEPGATGVSLFFSSHLPHTRGDEPPPAGRAAGDGAHLPHTRGDEPQRLDFCGLVGRASAPHAWG